MTYSRSLPPLPPHPPNQEWSANVQEAYELVSETYNRTHRVLQTHDSDTFRLGIIREALTEIHPLVVSLYEGGVDEEWVRSCAEAVAGIQQAVSTAQESASSE